MPEYSEAMSEISGYPKALSHAGTGGDALKPLTIANKYSESIGIYGIIVDGIYYGTAGMSGEATPYLLEAGKTITAYYAEPSPTSVWGGNLADGMQTLVSLITTSAGVFVNGVQFAIDASAANPSIDIVSKGTPAPGN